MIKYVTYKRVSTKDQGKSGLGLEAQERDIQLFLENYSGQPYEVIGDYTEVQSGTDDQRPVLADAIAQAKKEGAILLIAKLDRLSRKVSFIAALMDDKKLDLKVASMPNADKFQLHIYAALAEQERDFISKRTKAALAEVKRKAYDEGKPNPLGGLRDKTMKRNKVRQEQANKNAKKLEGLVIPMRERGDSLRNIAKALNEAGVKTARGSQWQAPQVKRLIERLA